MLRFQVWRTPQKANFTADPLRVTGELLDGFGGGAQQEAVDELLVTACKRAQFCRQGAGDQEMLHWQEQGLAGRQPFGSVVIAAFGTTAIFAGVVAVAIVVTRLAAIAATTEGFGAAAHDVTHGAFVTPKAFA